MSDGKAKSTKRRWIVDTFYTSEEFQHQLREHTEVGYELHSWHMATLPQRFRDETLDTAIIAVFKLG